MFSANSDHRQVLSGECLYNVRHRVSMLRFHHRRVGQNFISYGLSVELLLVAGVVLWTEWYSLVRMCSRTFLVLLFLRIAGVSYGLFMACVVS